MSNVCVVQVGSAEPVEIDVTPLYGLTASDYDIDFAFVDLDAKPIEADWKSSTWVTENGVDYGVTQLDGTLDAGLYDAYLRIVAPGGTPLKYIGRLKVR
jgi:hypothetical protein